MVVWSLKYNVPVGWREHLKKRLGGRVMTTSRLVEFQESVALKFMVAELSWQSDSVIDAITSDL